jgi:hypothetical protein
MPTPPAGDSRCPIGRQSTWPRGERRRLRIARWCTLLRRLGSPQQGRSSTHKRLAVGRFRPDSWLPGSDSFQDRPKRPAALRCTSCSTAQQRRIGRDHRRTPNRFGDYRRSQHMFQRSLRYRSCQGCCRRRRSGQRFPRRHLYPSQQACRHSAPATPDQER